MQILGVEFEFDFCDADHAEVYERETRRVLERVNDKRQYEGKSNADGIRIQCRIIDNFFDAVFGNGAADKLFHGKSNLREHMEAFSEMSDAAKKSSDDLRTLAGRYAPNRAARRQEQKQQKRMHGPGYVSASGYSILNEDPGPEGAKGPIGDPAKLVDYVNRIGAKGPTNEVGDPGSRGPKGIPDASDTNEQIPFIEKFIQLMPEMEAFMQAYRSRQENGNG